MTLRNDQENLGSSIALSMAAATNPAALPAMVIVAGVGVTITAATFAYRKISAIKDKKNHDLAEAINRLHTKHLQKIKVGNGIDIGLPQIFKLPDKEGGEIDSMHFTDEEVADIGKSTPNNTDVSLANYRRSVMNAILKLKEYYLSRPDRKDVTAGVLSYLLYMLESKCLNFSGYEYDIAYIDAISRFINAYASLEGYETTQHFSRLSPVYEYLNKAEEHLKYHRKMMTLKGVVCELSQSCESLSEDLIKSFVKATTEASKWPYIETATHDEMARNILRRQYVYRHVIGLVLSTDPEVIIPESIFREWLHYLLSYFEESINPDSPMKIGDILPPEDIFKLPNLDMPTPESKKQLESIRHLFSICENFITRKHDNSKTGHSPRFLTISDDKEMLERSKFIVGLATLTHQTISLKYLCVNLQKSLKQLGEIYFKCPQHYAFLFNLLDELSYKIRETIEHNQELLAHYQEIDGNAMQLERQEIFPQDIEKLFDRTQAMALNLVGRIHEYRDKSAIDEPTMKNEIEQVRHEMFELADKLANVYHIKNSSGGSPMKSHHTEKSKPYTPAASVAVQIEPEKSSPTFFESLFIKIRRLKSWLYEHTPSKSVVIFSTIGILITASANIISNGTLSLIGAAFKALNIAYALSKTALLALDALAGFLIGAGAGFAINRHRERGLHKMPDNIPESTTAMNTALEVNAATAKPNNNTEHHHSSAPHSTTKEPKSPRHHKQPHAHVSRNIKISTTSKTAPVAKKPHKAKHIGTTAINTESGKKYRRRAAGL